MKKGNIIFALTVNVLLHGIQLFVTADHTGLTAVTNTIELIENHPSNELKLPGTTVCLPSDHVVHIHDGQCLSNKKKHNQQHLDL